MSQLYLFVPDGWRDCGNPECAAEWGPMPPREFAGDPAHKVCSVCYLERVPDEVVKVKDRMRYTPERRAALVRRNRERAVSLPETERRAMREKRSEYDRRRYASRSA